MMHHVRLHATLTASYSACKKRAEICFVLLIRPIILQPELMCLNQKVNLGQLLPVGNRFNDCCMEANCSMIFPCDTVYMASVIHADGLRGHDMRNFQSRKSEVQGKIPFWVGVSGILRHEQHICIADENR